MLTVNETLDNHYGFLVYLYQVLPKHWAKLHELGLKDIIMIELPVLPNENNVELLQLYCSDKVETPENCLWSIQYHLGLDNCYYCPATIDLC